MARKLFRIDEFGGIDQSKNPNAAGVGMSPDACNMDTDDGGLRVAKGYVKHIEAPIPGTGNISKLILYRRSAGDQFIAIAGSSIYACRDGAWSLVYTYPTAIANHAFDYVQAQINSVDYLIVGSGEGQLVKYDGATASLFGSAEGLSNMPVLYLAMYRSRLFSAGDPNYPNRLYWSQLPGDTRSIENWAQVEESPNVEGGHAEVGDTGSDPIIGLKALSNQLVIFKRHSAYRLIGDRPGNFIIEPIEGTLERMAHTSVVSYGDSLFGMGKGGMCYFNGVSLKAMPDARRIRKFLEGAEVFDSRGAICRDKLCFTASEADGDALVEYDLQRGVYMIRRGFPVKDICAWDGKLYLVNAARYVCRFNEGSSYDGAPIAAWWQTPPTDLYDKGSIKAMRELYLRGATDDSDSALLVDVKVGGNTTTYRLLLPREDDEVLEVPLRNEGRTFSLRFYNEAGGWFSIEAGAELCFEQWRRTE